MVGIVVRQNERFPELPVQSVSLLVNPALFPQGLQMRVQLLQLVAQFLDLVLRLPDDPSVLPDGGPVDQLHCSPVVIRILGQFLFMEATQKRKNNHHASSDRLCSPFKKNREENEQKEDTDPLLFLEL